MHSYFGLGGDARSVPPPLWGVEARVRDAAQGGAAVPPGVGRGKDHGGRAQPRHDQGERSGLPTHPQTGPQALPQPHSI